jgi:hypothetical protein
MRKAILIFGAKLVLDGVPVSSAIADGCVKGAVIDGVVGHESGHHGLVGAAAWVAQ